VRKNLQRGRPIAGQDIELHQVPVRSLVQGVVLKPMPGRLNGLMNLAALKLQPREPIENLIQALMPRFPLLAGPVVKAGRISQGKALQEFAPIRGDGGFEQ
jgi:hypothetical protein